jgi:hypothetical protein
MINFYLSNFMNARNALWQEVLQAKSKASETPNESVPISLRPRIERNVKCAIRDCVAALQIEEASRTSIDLERLFSLADVVPYNWQHLNLLLDRLWEDIEYGMHHEMFFHYPREMADLLQSYDYDWKETISAFPSARRGISASIDCYAHNDYSGCVFHMMGLAELGLRAIAGERGVEAVGKSKPIEWGTWQDVFQAIEDRLKVVRHKKAGPNRDLALKFYDTAISDLRRLQGYRDPTMHFRQSYDKGEAYDAMYRTKSLMQTLSTKLREDGSDEIDWELG